MTVSERFYLILHPRPAYVIGSGRMGEKVNFMAASWVMPVSEEPPRVALAVDKETYTYELILENKEFTINVLTDDHVNDLMFFGKVSGRDVDKAKVRGFKVKKGKKTDAPVLDEAIGVVECKVYTSVDCGDTVLFIGDVVSTRVDESLYNERYGWDFSKIRIPLHNSGRVFLTLGRLIFARKI